MKGDIRIEELSHSDPDYKRKLFTLREQLGGVRNPYLFPAHFLASAFPKLGGRLILAKRNGIALGAGFLFPRAFSGSGKVYTCRWHRLLPEPEERVDRVVNEYLSPDSAVLYIPEQAHHFRQTEIRKGEISFGRPSEEEAGRCREIQRSIWGYEGDEFLYPVDFHSVDFCPGTSLVARKDGEVIGFLFGFYKFTAAPMPKSLARRYKKELKIESQLLGVLPSYRGRGLGQALKKMQAHQALEDGIRLINWTVDPLQFRNAVLNFGELHAVSFQFAPNYYPFENVLNRVPSSRLVITWPIASRRVASILEEEVLPKKLNLKQHPNIPVVNEDLARLNLSLKSPQIAFRIPERWTELQNSNLEEARLWREMTDKAFSIYIGPEENDYMIVSVGEKDESKYLLAERITPDKLVDLLPGGTEVAENDKLM